MTDDYWADRFHWCALAARFIAVSEGRLSDSDYVRRLAYEFYEDGAFAEKAKARKSASLPAQLGTPD